MQTTLWICFESEHPTLVLRAQPEVCLVLKRFPQGGDFFKWNGERWRVRDVGLKEFHLSQPDAVFRRVEAVSGPLPTFEECSGCGGLISCTEFCRVGLHRDLPNLSAPSFFRKRKVRSPTLDAPLREIVSRRGNVEILDCGHQVHYRFFKYIDRSALYRRCLECCLECTVRERTVKRPRIL